MSCLSKPRVTIDNLQVDEIADTEDAIMEYVATRGPVAVGIHTPASFQSYSQGLSKTRRDETRRAETRRDEPRRDETRRGETRREVTRRDETRRDETRRDETRRDETIRDETRRNYTVLVIWCTDFTCIQYT